MCLLPAHSESFPDPSGLCERETGKWSWHILLIRQSLEDEIGCLWLKVAKVLTNSLQGLTLWTPLSAEVAEIWGDLDNKRLFTANSSNQLSMENYKKKLCIKDLDSWRNQDNVFTGSHLKQHRTILKRDSESAMHACYSLAEGQG